MLSNPYSLREHLIQCRVSSDHAFFLRRLFPMKKGAIDAALSSLFHAFITELKALEKTNGHPFEPAYHPYHPTVIAIESILRRCSFGSVAGNGPSSPRDDAGPTDGIHKTELSPTPERTKPKGGSVQRKNPAPKKGRGKE